VRTPDHLSSGRGKQTLKSDTSDHLDLVRGPINVAAASRTVLYARGARCTGVARYRFAVLIFRKLGDFPLEIIRIHAYSWSTIPTPSLKPRRVTRLLQDDFNHGPFLTPIEVIWSVCHSV
jgi:hypothetical protein